MSVDPLIRGLAGFAQHQEAKQARGLAKAGRAITDGMRATTAHGDQTGATRAGYVAYAVGAGETGRDALDGAVQAVEAKNPGRSATASVTLPQDSLGLVITDPTDYQHHLERENAGAKAVLGPTLQAVAASLTKAAAEG